MRFANPEAFLLLPLVPLVLWWSLRPRHHGAARFSALRLAGRLPAGWAVLGPVLMAGLRAGMLTLLLVALARPQTSDARERSYADGITLQLVIDNSYSMRNRDYDLGGESISRLDAVKHAVELFVAGGHGLSGRPNDRIGVITFARDPDVVCPLTLDHAAVMEAVNGISLAPPVGTNIGDALAWALDRLRDAPTKQKVVILLTDGGHNIKEGMQPLEAAQLAADLKIRVYTIGAVGNRFGKEPTLADVLRQVQGQRMPGDSVDEPLMEAMAATAGGKYYRATDTEGLANIYKDIDQLETTRMDRTVEVSHKDWYLLALLPAVGLLLMEQGLGATRLLRIP
jgi:Ca-activated chloride channel family protein